MKLAGLLVALLSLEFAACAQDLNLDIPFQKLVLRNGLT